MIALRCPAGTGTDRTLTSADTTGLCLEIPNTTSAPHRIKVKCKLKWVFFLSRPLCHIGSEQINFADSSRDLAFYRVSAHFGVLARQSLNRAGALNYREVLNGKKWKIELCFVNAVFGSIGHS